MWVLLAYQQEVLLVAFGVKADPSFLREDAVTGDVESDITRHQSGTPFSRQTVREWEWDNDYVLSFD